MSYNPITAQRERRRSDREEIARLNRVIEVMKLERRMLLLPRKQWLSVALLPPVVTSSNRERMAA